MYFPVFVAETRREILVSFADIYLTVMNAGNNIRRPIWCVHTAGRSDLSQSFLSVSGYVHSSGKASGVDSNVKFIIETDPIE